MNLLKIEGGIPLMGTASVSGAKNAILPLLAASIMVDGLTTFTNVPNLSDVDVMMSILQTLNLRVNWVGNTTLVISNTSKISSQIPYELVSLIRASFFVAGPVLAKRGCAKIPLPGGCSIGLRPVDIHLKGFEALGAKVSVEHGFVNIESNKPLKGTTHSLRLPSVGATENLIMAACFAEGETILNNIAKEPEVIDLIKFLNHCGGKIELQNNNSVYIKGVSSLKSVFPHTVIPDRIEAATLLIAAAITKGNLTLTNLHVEHLDVLLEVLRSCGYTIRILDKSVLHIDAQNVVPLPCNLTTTPFPGFPTDMQAIMMSLLSIADGVSTITEAMFDNRFMHVQELLRLGANIQIESSTAIIRGVRSLSGAPVKIPDLRAGASLIVAALVAKGHTTLTNLSHVERGYEGLPKKLASLGAIIHV